jgi:hypothetical protein
VLNTDHLILMLIALPCILQAFVKVFSDAESPLTYHSLMTKMQ